MIHGKQIGSGTIGIAKLNLSGTPDGSQFLRDDGSWQAVPETFAQDARGNIYISVPEAGYAPAIDASSNLNLVLDTRRSFNYSPYGILGGYYNRLIGRGNAIYNYNFTANPAYQSQWYKNTLIGDYNWIANSSYGGTEDGIIYSNQLVGYYQRILSYADNYSHGMTYSSIIGGDDNQMQVYQAYHRNISMLNCTGTTLSFNYGYNSNSLTFVGLNGQSIYWDNGMINYAPGTSDADTVFLPRVRIGVGYDLREVAAASKVFTDPAQNNSASHILFYDETYGSVRKGPRPGTVLDSGGNTSAWNMTQGTVTPPANSEDNLFFNSQIQKSATGKWYRNSVIGHTKFTTTQMYGTNVKAVQNNIFMQSAGYVVLQAAAGSTQYIYGNTLVGTGGTVTLGLGNTVTGYVGKNTIIGTQGARISKLAAATSTEAVSHNTIIGGLNGVVEVGAGAVADTNDGRFNTVIAPFTTTLTDARRLTVINIGSTQVYGGTAAGGTTFPEYSTVMGDKLFFGVGGTLPTLSSGYLTLGYDTATKQIGTFTAGGGGWPLTGTESLTGNAYIEGNNAYKVVLGGYYNSTYSMYQLFMNTVDGINLNGGDGLAYVNINMWGSTAVVGYGNYISLTGGIAGLFFTGPGGNMDIGTNVGRTQKGGYGWITNISGGYTHFIGQTGDLKFTATGAELRSTSGGISFRGASSFYMVSLAGDMDFVSTADISINTTNGGGAGTAGDYMASDGTNVYWKTPVSDIRLKKGIRPIQDALQMVRKLEPIQFAWDRNTWTQGKDGDYFGFSAQNLEQVDQLLVENFESKEGSYLKIRGRDQLLAIITQAVKEIDERLLKLEGN